MNGYKGKASRCRNGMSLLRIKALCKVNNNMHGICCLFGPNTPHCLCELYLHGH